MIQKLSFSFSLSFSLCSSLSFIGLGLLTVVTSAQAQAPTASTYPNKPVKVVVGFAPGGAADYVARTISDSLGKSLGQPIIVENKAGAGSSIAAEAVAKSASDGYTVLIASPSSISVNPALNPKLGYAPKDLLPVTKITTSPLVIAANPNAGIGSLLELVAKAKKAPGTINYATSGNGSAPHLGAALFAQVTGIEMTHIPFRGGGHGSRRRRFCWGASERLVGVVPGEERRCKVSGASCACRQGRRGADARCIWRGALAGSGCSPRFTRIAGLGESSRRTERSGVSRANCGQGGCASVNSECF